MRSATALAGAAFSASALLSDIEPGHGAERGDGSETGHDLFTDSLRDLRSALAALFALLGMTPEEARGAADKAVAGEDLPDGQSGAPGTVSAAARGPSAFGLGGLDVPDGAARTLGIALSKGARALHWEMIALLLRLGMEPAAARVAASRLLAGVAASGGGGDSLAPSLVLADIRRGVAPSAGAVGLALAVKSLTLERDDTHVRLHLDQLVLRGFPLASDGVRLVRGDTTGRRLTADLVIPTGVSLPPDPVADAAAIRQPAR